MSPSCVYLESVWVLPAAGMICFCVHKLSIIGGQRFYVQKYPHFGSRTCGWCEYKRKIVGLTVAAHQTPTMPPPPCAQESCPYVSHSFRCRPFLINGLLCWGRIASQPFQVHPGRVLVGGGHHDHRRLRGHDVGALISMQGTKPWPPMVMA